MVSKYSRVGICGASGTGKTKLAKHISNEYDLEYLNSSSSKHWVNFGYSTHEDVHRGALLNPTMGKQLQRMIYNEREELFSSSKSFVTDRTPIDQMAYYLNYFQLENPIHKVGFINMLQRQLEYFDAIIFVRFSNSVIEDNGLRILDPLYQLLIDALMDICIRKISGDTHLSIINLNIWDWDIRVEDVKNFLTK